MSEQGDRGAIPRLSTAYPQLFVAEIAASCAFFVGRLGFAVAFTYGEPPFYAQVRRDRARLNLRHVDGAVVDAGLRARERLLSAYIPVTNIAALYREYRDAGVPFRQPLTPQPWSAQDFIVIDPDGNLIGFSSPTDLQD